MNAIKRIITSLLLFLLTLLLFTQAFAQSEDSYTPNLPKVLPPTPEAASLGRYGDVPVSLHTGATAVSIPIFELEGKGVSVPVSLGYNSSGVRVEEVATWVGMGWNLNAGGTVTRSVRGLPDEFNFFGGAAFNADGTPYEPSCDRGDDNSLYYEGIIKGETDTHPDVFYYNLLGRSGKFFFDKNMNSFLMAKENLDIDHPFDSQTFSQQWRIRDEAGITYVLGSFEGQGAVESTESNRFCSYQQSLMSTPITDAITSWHLLAVIDPTGDIIRFQYDSYDMTYEINGGGSISYKLWGEGAQTKQSICQKNQITQHGVRLRSISSSRGSVEFIADTAPRCDVWSASTSAEFPKALAQIIVKDTQGNIIRDFRLGHDYFGSLSDLATCGSGNVSTEVSNRLRLRFNELKETFTGQGHSFDYYTPPSDSWPSRLSSAQDHWGYYNGKTGNQNLVPSLEYDGVLYAGADREPNLGYMRMAALKSITYPTGGTTIFDYGLHDYNGRRRMIQYRTRTEHLASVYVNTYSSYGNPANASSASFTLNEPTSVDINCVFNCTQPGGVEGCGFVTLTYPDGHSQDYGNCLAAGTGMRLQPGVYNLSAQILGGEAEVSFSVNARFTEVVPAEEIQKLAAGGLRIERITSDAQEGPPLVKKYLYETSSGVSNGSLLRELKYERIYTKDDRYYSGSDGTTNNPTSVCTGELNFAEYLEVKALTYVPLYYSSDYSLGYGEVAELLGENGEGGRTVYVYGLKEKDVDPSYGRYLEPMLGHRNSLLYNKTIYGRDGNRLLSVSNRYRFRDLVSVYGFELRQDHYSGCTRCGDTEYKVDPYTNLSEWYHLDSVVTKTFDPVNEALFVQNEEKFWYDNPNHLQQTRHQVKHSDGITRTTLTLYPQDYAQGTGFIDEMIDNHLVAYPIEQVSYLDRGSFQEILRGRVTTYLTGGKGLKASESLVESASPITASAFRFTNRSSAGIHPTGTPSPFLPDNRYRNRVTYDLYDAVGNLRQLTVTDNNTTAYLWGYGNTLPIAEVKPVSLNIVEETEPQVSSMGCTLTQSTSSETTIGNSLLLDRNQRIALAYSVTRFGSKPDVTFWLTVRDTAGKTWLSGKAFYNTAETAYLDLPSGTYTFSYTASLYPAPTSTSSGATIAIDVNYQHTLVRQNVFYTSFEESGKKSSLAKTGRKFHSGNFNFPLPAQSGKYLLTYWRKLAQGSVWEHVTEVVEVSSGSAKNMTISDSNTDIDEVRLHPFDTQMTTYTHDPLVGVTSSTDPNGHTTYYEYDGLGRLQVVKDQDGNILKEYQ